MKRKNWNIASHGETHIPLNKLTQKEILRELSKSKDDLECIINSRITSYTPPFGIIQPEHLKLIKAAGYKYIYVNSYYLDNLFMSKNKGLVLKKRHNVYSLNSIRTLKRKIDRNIFQEKIDNFIHKCSYATVITKEILSFNIK